MKTACKKHQLKKIACDLRDVNNLLTGDNTEMERFYIGEQIAFTLGAEIKLAIVAKKKAINYFAEKIARTRGAQFKICYDSDDALEWLLDYKG